MTPVDFRAHLLMYDIPTRSNIPNPSGQLWHYGAARVNLSCWIVPDTRLALLPIEDWRRAGAKVEMVRFDERDGETILRLAREALEREITRMRTTLESSVTEVRSRIDAAPTGDKDAFNRARYYANSHLWRAKKFAVAARECALAFDLLGDVGKLVDGLRDCVAAKDLLFYGWLRQKEESKPLMPVAEMEQKIAEAPPQTALPGLEPEAAINLIEGAQDAPDPKRFASIFGGTKDDGHR